MVVPAPVERVDDEKKMLSTGLPKHRDDEVENIAVDVATRSGRSRGCPPTDVSLDAEHYHISSESERREKLKQLGDHAWLYVVTFCKGEQSRFRIIQDPVSKLNREMICQQIQFLVTEADWQHRRIEVQNG